MDSIEIIGHLVGAGSAGAVICVVILFLRDRKETDTSRKESDSEFLDRLEKIESRHTEEERLARAQITELSNQNRAQIGELSRQNRELFDRVITSCVDLANAITQLKEQFKEQSMANEAAIRSSEELARQLFSESKQAIQNLATIVRQFEVSQASHDDADARRQGGLPAPRRQGKPGEGPPKSG